MSQHTSMRTDASMKTDVARTGEAQRQLLREMLREHIVGKPFSELFSVTLDHRVQGIVGEVVLSALADQGITADGFEAVGALTAAAVPIVASVIAAAREHGKLLDGFIMDFVYPSIKGPSIAGKRVVLLDSWLSEKSYIQTSSLVTLHHGNELNLDFGIVSHEKAEVVGIASLIGDVGAGLSGSGKSTDATGKSDTADSVDRSNMSESFTAGSFIAATSNSESPNPTRPHNRGGSSWRPAARYSFCRGFR